MNRVFQAQRLDVRAFAEDGGELSGGGKLHDFPRLAEEARDGAPEAAVQWSAQGELRNSQHVNSQIWLHLQASAVLPMTCQRCLEPVDVTLSVDRPFRFVADEETAAAQDDASEEDLLALSRSFDLPGLVEDELLMEVPVVPRHDACPAQVRLSAVDPGFDEQPPQHPFARLRVLKSGGN